MNKNWVPLLPVSMVKNTKTKKQKPPSMFSSVPAPPLILVSHQLVCIWALLSACIVGSSIVYNFVHPCDAVVVPAAAASRWATCLNLTDAEAVAVAASAAQAGQLWLSAAQATAAALALLLPPGPRRRALAFAAHAANAAGHLLTAMLSGVLFVPAPGNYNLVVNTAVLLVCGVIDVLAFLALLSSDDSEEEAAAE